MKFQTAIFACTTAGIFLAKAAHAQTAEELAIQISQRPAFQHPIIFIGEQTPPRAESQELWFDLTLMRTHGVPSGLAALENFVTNHLDSPWTPSLRNNLGYYYRKHGRYSLALEHWEAAWNATKNTPSGNGKKVADFAFAHWTRLLASLGRRDTLLGLFRETGDRLLDGGPLQQILNGTKEGFLKMYEQPTNCFRCGTLALSSVSRVLQPANLGFKTILRTPSPETGFSMTSLKALADQIGLNVLPVERTTSEIVVPSVVHWKLDHYAAITTRLGDRYQVVDPTFESTIWMDAETINAEGSGYLLVPAERLPATWRVLTTGETDQIFGRGTPNGIDDQKDDPCGDDENGDSQNCINPDLLANADQDSGPIVIWNATGGGLGGGGPFGGGGPGGGSGGSGGGGGGFNQCCEQDGGNCCGLAHWHVKQPWINLWLADQPLFYSKANGKRMLLKLTYKQRNARDNDFMFGFGPFWECNWMSYFTFDLGNVTYDAPRHYLPNGGVRTHTFVANSEYSGWLHDFKRSSMIITPTAGSGTCDVMLGYPEGATNYFGYVFEYDEGAKDSFITQQIDHRGRTNLFYYLTTNNVVHLTSVVDSDGRTNTISYTNNSYPHQITAITDPYGRTARFLYDNAGRLTNITDAIGMSSAFVYDEQGWVTNLATPYGTTVFKHTGTTGGFLNDDSDVVNRSCTVTEPNGSKQLFMYRDSAFFLNPTSSVPLIEDFPQPTIPFTTMFDGYVNVRVSFHWNRNQYSALSSAFRSSGSFYDLTLADYKLGRLRHWLHDGYQSVGGTLGYQREPRHDGATDGVITWYDYAGKDSEPYEGSNSVPSVIARILPDNTTNYTVFERNKWRQPTRVISSYGDGSVNRTNTYVYQSNGQDLHYALGPNDELQHGYSYNSYHQILTMTNAVGDRTVFNYDGSRRLSSIEHPSGLTNFVTYGSDGFLSEIADMPIARTNKFTYLNGEVRSRIDPRGLITTNYWDDLQRLVGVRHPDGTTTSNIFTYLDLTAAKDRRGYWSYAGYNSVRQKTADTNANGVVTHYGYCDCGQLLSVTNGWSSSVEQFTTFAYDYQGHLTNTTYADGYSVTNWFNSIGQLVTTGDGWGYRWFYYNNQGLLTNISNAYGTEQNTVFDKEDRAIWVTDANGVIVTNTYDDLGRLRTRTYPDGGVESFGYSARGLTAYTNQLSLTNYYTYDEAGRKTAETNANAEVIRYYYNSAGDLLQLVDGKTQTNKWNHNEYGLVTNKVDQAGTEILRYKYDPDNRLTNRWSVAKGDTKYKYDPVGNLTNIDYAASTDVKFIYDALNRVTTMVDAAGTNSYAYTSGGQLWTEDGPFASDTVTNIYFNRLRTNLALVQPTSVWTNKFGYDAAKRLTNVVSPAGTFAYTLGGASAASPLIKKLLLPNTSYTTNTYDNVARLTGTYLKNSSHSTLDSAEYGYNLSQQRTTFTNAAGTYISYTFRGKHSKLVILRMLKLIAAAESPS